MNLFRYTVGLDVDDSLAGVPARLHSIRDCEIILEFLDGSFLAVVPTQLLGPF